MFEIPYSCGETKTVYTSEESYQPPGPRTDEIYRTRNLPLRFIYPRVFKGYRETEITKPHPFYRSTSMDYGWYTPTIHTVPTSFYPKNTGFSSEISRGGMYRNCSLNTELDKTFY